jgi:hypothetical protein
VSTLDSSSTTPFYDGPRKMLGSGGIQLIGNAIKEKASLVPIAFSLIFFVAAFFAGISSGVATSFSAYPTTLVGTAAAISSQVYGLKGHPYQAYNGVITSLEKSGLIATAENYPQNFRNYALITAALHAAQSVDLTQNADFIAVPNYMPDHAGTTLVSDPGNDQGVIEFIHAAFRLFGIDVKSLYYFYFVILGVSVAAYLASFWRDYIACTVLFATACAIYSFMPGFVYHENDLVSLATPRFLSTLGIIPTLHIAFLIVRGDAPHRKSNIASTVVQSVIISFAYAARGSSMWMLLALLALFVLYLVRVLGPTFKQKTPAFVASVIRRRGVFALLAIAIAATLGVTRAEFLVPQGDNYRHAVWHNMFLAFETSPEWGPGFSSEFNDKRGDAISEQAVSLYLATHHMPPIDAKITWATWETVLRSVTIDFIKEYPKLALRSFLVDRPAGLITSLGAFRDAVRSSVPVYVYWVILGMCCCLGILGSDTALQRHSPTFWFAICVLALTLSFALPLVLPFLVYTVAYLILNQAFLVVTLWAVLGVCCCLRILISDTAHQRLTFLDAICVLALSFAVSLFPGFLVYTAVYTVSDQAFLLVTILIALTVWTYALITSLSIWMSTKASQRIGSLANTTNTPSL